MTSPSTAKRTSKPFPIGTIREHAGILRIKVRLHGRVQDQWKDHARFVYEQKHGPVPPGKRVMHLDGDTVNDDPSNLALGDPGDAIFLWAENNPGAEARRIRRVRSVTAATNRQRAEILREREVLSSRWYAIDQARQVIINRPHKRKCQVLADYGLDAYSLNGARLLPVALGFPDLSGPVAAAVVALIEFGPMRIHELCRRSTDVRQRFGGRVEMKSTVLLSRMTAAPPGLISRTRSGRHTLYSATPLAASTRLRTFPYTLIYGADLRRLDTRTWAKLPDYERPAKEAAA